jgi:TIR domain
MAASAQPGLEPRIFRIFISYASEDLPIAAAIGTCLKTALGDFFAEVNLDKGFLQPGLAFKKQIESKLQKTDVLLIVYTGAEKQSHGFTGWEVGYFDHVMETTSGRLKIALYLDNPPAISSEEQGIQLSLGRDKREMTTQQFETDLVVRPDEPICLLLEKWQAEVGRIIEGAGLQKPQNKPEQEPVTCVRNLKLAIFRYLKGTVETIVEPQKQIIIRVKGSALEHAIDTLPPDAELHPKCAGMPMAIFSLQDEQITWEKFLSATADNRFCDSWREAITSVVLSSFPDRVNVDNSQVILSSDEAKAYRVILTTATKYYDDYREFSVYFVEMLHRADYGDEATSNLLKGLELVCRFRFMFLETDSEFSSGNVSVSNVERLPELARRLLKELNLLRKDARDAGMDEARVWRKFVTWEHLEAIAAAYRPRETTLREIIAKIAAVKGDPTGLMPLRQELSGVLEELENAIRPENTILIREMARKLEEIADDEHNQDATGQAARPDKE